MHELSHLSSGEPGDVRDGLYVAETECRVGSMRLGRLGFGEDAFVVELDRACELEGVAPGRQVVRDRVTAAALGEQELLLVT